MIDGRLVVFTPRLPIEVGQEDQEYEEPKLEDAAAGSSHLEGIAFAMADATWSVRVWPVKGCRLDAVLRESLDSEHPEKRGSLKFKDENNHMLRNMIQL